MMASLDTNIIIHLYQSACSNVLFDVFDEIYVSAFIRNIELNNHGTAILTAFDKDVSDGKIIIVDDDYLKSIGMLSIYHDNFKEEQILYSPLDLGEVHATALARTLGIFAVVTDDIKLYGPHYTLMMTPYSEVIPFAFHEVLMLAYLCGTIECEEYINMFDHVNENCRLNWNFSQKIKTTIRRFLEPPNTDHEKKWIEDYCSKHNTEFKSKMKLLLQTYDMLKTAQ